MIDLEVIEFNNEDAIKESKNIHPTLKQVEKKMRGFPEELVMYMYHHLNGREEEAQTYLQEWEDEQQSLRSFFQKVNELNNPNQILSSDNVTDVSITGQYPPSNTISDNKE